MKIIPADLDALRAAIAPLDSADIRARAVALGYSDERFRWDLLHASRFNTRGLYAYANDSHIDTALRAIVPILERQPNPQPIAQPGAE